MKPSNYGSQVLVIGDDSERMEPMVSALGKYFPVAQIQRSSTLRLGAP